jgi:hypothetical protein
MKTLQECKEDAAQNWFLTSHGISGDYRTLSNGVKVGNIRQRNLELVCDDAAERYASQFKASEPIGKPDVIKFLLGEGELDGVWYGEHPGNKGPFWWRTELRKLFEASEPIEKEQEGLSPMPDLDGWSFDYDLILKLKVRSMDFGEDVSMENIDAVLKAMCEKFIITRKQTDTGNR